MGGSQSLAGNSDLGTKHVLNFLLKEMLRRSDLVDLYSLADPGKCKEYVILSAKEIGRLFTEVNLTPKERGGSLFIQSIEGIKRLSPEEQLVHDANCKKIAFFFIRIFQTFGALTLSVIDDSIPAVDPAPVADKRDRPRYEKAFARPLPFAPPPKTGWTGRGGALTNDPRSRGYSYFIRGTSGENDFQILNQYFVTPSAGATDTNPMTFDRESSIVIPQETLYNNVGSDTRSVKIDAVPQVIYRFRDIDGSKRITANLSIRVSEGRYTVSLSSVKINGTPSDKVTGSVSLELEEDFPRDPRPKDRNDKELPAILVTLFKQIIATQFGISMLQFLLDRRYIDAIDRTTSISGTRIQIPYKPDNYRAAIIPIVYSDSIRVDNKTETIRIEAGLVIKKTDDRSYNVGLDFNQVKVSPDYMRQMVDFTGFGAQKSFTANSDSAEPLNDKGERIPVYLQRRFDALLKPAKSGEGRVGTRYTREGLPKPYVLPGVPAELRIEGLWNALIKSPPVKAHCVARALQLLSVAGIRGDATAPAFSNICNTRFQLVVDHSLPGLGKPIVEEYGIAAMASLFIDGLQNNMPLVTNGPKYQEFLKRLNMTFYGFKSLEETPQPSAIGDVIDQPLSSLCVGQGPIQIEAARQSRIKRIAMQLMSRQKQHYSSVMTLLYRLFDGNKVKAGAFEINPSIMAGGIEAVNSIATDARELLITYYSDCEETYKDGVILLQEQERGKRAVAAPVAPVAPPENQDEENNENLS
jgi:hypothetical protein